VKYKAEPNSSTVGAPSARRVKLMPRGYKQYPNYKDSGVEWLEEIPEGWEVATISRLFDIKAGGDLKKEFFSETLTDKCCYPIYTNITKTKLPYGYTSKAIFNKNTITVTGRGDVGYAVYRESEYDAIIRLLVLSPKNSEPCKYFMYYINEVLEFQVAKTAISQLSTEQISPYRLTVPPLQEQKSIANYLDKAIAKIDTLIEKQTKLIELLKEKRQAVISSAVTRGLDASVPMKDSGVEWLGEIPEHWVASRLKHLTKQIIDGAHFTPTYVDNGVPFLRVTDLHNEVIDLSKVKFIPLSEHKELIKRCNPQKGDLLLSKNGTIGLTKIVTWDWEFSVFVSLCLIKFLQDKMLPEFFMFIFQSSGIEEQLSHSSKKTSVTNLHLDKINALYFSVPPVKEQREIVSNLKKSSLKFESLITKSTQAISLLKEKRTALISACVTGKIDVRDAA